MLKSARLLAAVGSLTVFLARMSWSSPPDGGGPLGVGLILGAPTGVSLKYWTGRDTAVDAAVAVRSSDLQIHGDYLWHPEWIRVERGRMPVYMGLGGRLHLKDEDSVVGLRLVGGAAYHFPDHPFDVFAEVVPSVRVAPSFGGDMDVAVGVRYYFRTQYPGGRSRRNRSAR